MERCYLQQDGTYLNCGVNVAPLSEVLDLEDPSGSPNAHFDYYAYGTQPDSYFILASRNSLDNGSGDDSDVLGLEVNAGVLTRAGKGIYSPIGNSGAAWLEVGW